VDETCTIDDGLSLAACFSDVAVQEPISVEFDTVITGFDDGVMMCEVDY